MAEPFLGMIISVPYNFAPQGWAFCAGQLLPISQNTALFSLLGTTFGGNGHNDICAARPARPGACRHWPGAGAVEL